MKLRREYALTILMGALASFVGFALFVLSQVFMKRP